MIFGWRKGRRQSQPLFVPPAEVRERRDSRDEHGAGWSMTTRAVYAVASIATLASISQNVGRSVFDNQAQWEGQDAFEKKGEPRESRR